MSELVIKSKSNEAQSCKFEDNEYNDGFSYDNWGGYNLLAKLNQRNEEVKNYICDVIRYWVSEFDVDGIRLDAADVLDFDLALPMLLPLYSL